MQNYSYFSSLFYWQREKNLILKCNLRYLEFNTLNLSKQECSKFKDKSYNL